MYRRVFLGTLVLVLNVGGAHAQETLFPWEELKALYRHTLERELLEAAEARPQLATLTSAQYAITATETEASGEVELRG